MQATYRLLDNERVFLVAARAAVLQAYANAHEHAENLARANTACEAAKNVLDGALKLLLNSRGLESAVLSEDCSELRPNLPAVPTPAATPVVN